MTGRAQSGSDETGPGDDGYTEVWLDAGPSGADWDRVDWSSLDLTSVDMSGVDWSMDRPEDPEIIELILPPRPEIVSVARLVVGAAVALDPTFDEERAAELRLAASEACTNAIEAQIANRHEGDEERPIVLRCELGPETIVLTVQDHAGGFDPDDLSPHPPVSDPARLDHEGGLGIPFIRLLSDELEFRSSPGGTTVVMTFGPSPASGRIEP